jgi:hypothetical protein
VTGVIRRWLDPRHRYFKLRGDDGGTCLPRHETVDDRWALTRYDSGRRDETRLSCTSTRMTGAAGDGSGMSHPLG